MDRAIKTGTWEKIPGTALGDAVIGVIGVGSVGSAVLGRARAFGARTLGNDIREIDAGLDVFEDEPLPATSPLRAMDNVMLAPHNSNSSPGAWERVHQSTLEQLLAGLKAAK